MPDAATARTPWRRVILALALSPFIPLAIILALGGLAFTGGLVSDPHGFVSRFKPDPILPAWAYPEGDVIRDGGCGGNDPKRPPCQWIIVGTNAPIEGIRADLEAAFSERGWDISDIFLRAKSPKGDVCIAYSHRPWEKSHKLFRQDDGQRYSTEISISVDNCAPYAG